MDAQEVELWQQFKANELIRNLQENSNIFSDEAYILFYSLVLGLIDRKDQLLEARLKTKISQLYLKTNILSDSLQYAKDAIVACPAYFPAYQQLAKVLQGLRISNYSAPVLIACCFRNCKLEQHAFNADNAAKFFLDLLKCIQDAEVSEDDVVTKLLLYRDTDDLGFGQDWNRVLVCFQNQASEKTFQVIVCVLNRSRARQHLTGKFLIAINSSLEHASAPESASVDSMMEHETCLKEDSELPAACTPAIAKNCVERIAVEPNHKEKLADLMWSNPNVVVSVEKVTYPLKTVQQFKSLETLESAAASPMIEIGQTKSLENPKMSVVQIENPTDQRFENKNMEGKPTNAVDQNTQKSTREYERKPKQKKQRRKNKTAEKSVNKGFQLGAVAEPKIPEAKNTDKKETDINTAGPKTAGENETSKDMSHSTVQWNADSDEESGTLNMENPGACIADQRDTASKFPIQMIKEEIERLTILDVESRAIRLPQPEDVVDTANVIDPLDSVDMSKLQTELDEVEDGSLALGLDGSTGDDIEKHEWEVEYTSDVWRILCSDKLPMNFKHLVCRLVYCLAQGHWQLASAISNDSDKLFQTQVTKSSYIIWERAIAFSPRLSQRGGKAGHIYTEVIRLWAIAMNDEIFQQSVKAIQASRRRGESCLFSVQLRQEDRVLSSQNSTKYPKRYGVTAIEASDKRSDSFLLRPPGSYNESEFHVVKFYSWSSNFVHCILHSEEKTADFPYKVTEAEWEIINLDVDIPIILIGRSGTGKTTCAVFRMFDAFYQYWISAGDIQSPQIKATSRFQCVAGSNDDDDAEDTEPEDTPLVHLHQVFIVKNPVLCGKVMKCFRNLYNGSKKNLPEFEFCDDLPQTLADAKDLHFPMFFSMRKLLLMLDASLPEEKFFKKEKDITDWLEIETCIDSLLETPCKNFQAGCLSSSDTSGPQGREVTFETFCYEFWPTIKNKSDLKENLKDIHPSLAWTEIISYIKGTHDALLNPDGVLSENEYCKIGAKKAPEFNSNRRLIYNVFKSYKSFCQNNSRFDYCDVVRHIYQRFITGLKRPSWKIHEIFVDETQDFTEAELFLCLCIGQNVNRTFFTGDTAQSIFRGISFRFEDLRSLYYKAKKSFHNLDPTYEIKVPEIQCLAQNYRSHNGILSLASSVLRILGRFFPESYDSRLLPDTGLFPGPKPCLVDSSSREDLEILLGGKVEGIHRHIEFGAHQVIIVLNDDSRQYLKYNFPFLAGAMIVTVYESKGLEFDDVILFNFFKDSPANAEWRVVKTFLNELEIEAKSTSPKLSMMPPMMKFDAITKVTRPRTFQPEKDKILSSILKQLYTAVTRARVNLWIFDESVDNRAPLFEFFLVLDVAALVKKDDNSSILHAIRGSTSAEWKRQGDHFFLINLFELAEHCYHAANENKLADYCKTKRNFQVAVKSGSRDEFVILARKYLELGLIDPTVECLQRCSEYKMAAILCQKVGEHQKAIRIYEQAQMYTEVASYMETMGDQSVIEYLTAKHFYLEAIHCMKRMIESPDLESVALQGADHYVSTNPTKLTQVLEFVACEKRIKFLLEKSKFELVAQHYVKNNQQRLAAELLYIEGTTTKLLMKAKEYASEIGDNGLSCLCSIAIAENMLHEHSTKGKGDASHISDFIINTCISSSKSTLNATSSAYCQLLLYKATHKMESLKNALFEFKNHYCPIGIAFVLQEVMRLFSDDTCKHDQRLEFWLHETVNSMQSLFELLFWFETSTPCHKEEWNKEICQCFQFLGLKFSSLSEHLHITKAGRPPFYWLFKSKKEIQNSDMAYMKASKAIFEFLRTLIPCVWNTLQSSLTSTFKFAYCPNMCEAYQIRSSESNVLVDFVYEECLKTAIAACKKPNCRYHAGVYSDSTEFRQIVLTIGRIMRLYCHVVRYMSEVAIAFKRKKMHWSRDKLFIWNVVFKASEKILIPVDISQCDFIDSGESHPDVLSPKETDRVECNQITLNSPNSNAAEKTDSLSNAEVNPTNFEHLQGSHNQETMPNRNVNSLNELLNESVDQSTSFLIDKQLHPGEIKNSPNQVNEKQTQRENDLCVPHGSKEKISASNREVEFFVYKYILNIFVENFPPDHMFGWQDPRIFPLVDHFYEDANYLFQRIYGTETKSDTLDKLGKRACDLLNAISIEHKRRLNPAPDLRRYQLKSSHTLPIRLQGLALKNDGCDFCGDTLAPKTNECTVYVICIQYETRQNHCKTQRHFENLRDFETYAKTLTIFEESIKNGWQRLQVCLETAQGVSEISATVERAKREFNQAQARIVNFARRFEAAKQWKHGEKELQEMINQLGKLTDSLEERVKTSATTIQAAIHISAQASG